MEFLESESFIPITGIPNRLSGPSQLDLIYEDQEKDPTLIETVAAAFRQANTVVNAGAILSNIREKLQVSDPNFNPIDKIKDTDYAPYARSFVYATNDDQVERIKSEIDKDLQSRDVLARSGWVGIPALIVAGGLDPLMWTLPVGRLANLAKSGSLLTGAVGNAAKNALVFGGAVTAQEYLLMQANYTKTYGEAAMAVGGATVLGGLLGGGASLIGKRKITLDVPKTEAALEQIFKYGGIGEEIAGDTRFAKDFGTKNVTLERSGLVGKLPGFTINQRLSTSELPTSRRISAALPENAMITKGDTGGAAVETIVNQKHAQDYTQLNRAFNAGYKEFLEAQGKAGIIDRATSFGRSGNLYDMFSEELVTAMTRGDVSDIPQVAKVAKQWRPVVNKIGQELIDTNIIPIRTNAISEVTERLKPINKEVVDLEKRLLKTKLKKARTKIENELSIKRTALKNLEDELKLIESKRFTVKDLDLQGTAQSWFHRMFNKHMIRNNPREFEADVSRFISSKYGVSLQEANVAAREVLDKITLNNETIVSNSFGMSKGTFKGRTLLIPDDVLRPWLVNDSLVVMDNWIKTAYAQIELKKMFGSLTLDTEKQLLRSEAKSLEAAFPARAAKIRKNLASDLKDIDVLLLRMQGLQGVQFEDGAFYSILRTVRNFNNAVLMGSLALNTFTDIGQMVLQNGFVNTFGGISELFLKKVFNPKAYKEVVEDMESIGIGVTAFTNNSRSLYDLGTGVPIGMQGERLSQQLANLTFKASLVSHVDGFTKRVASYVSAKRIYRNVQKGAENIPANELSWMRNLGIKDADYADLAAQIKRYSRVKDKLTIFNSQKWTNENTRNVFSAALKKVENVSIITPGIGDAPILFDNPAFQLLFQYKRFAMAAAQRSLVPALQRTDAGVAAGLAIMFTGGMLGEVVRTTLRGDDPRDLDLDTLVSRAIKRVDMGSYLIDIYGIGHHFIGDAPYNKSASDEIFGPAAGLLNRSSVATQGIMQALKGQALTKQQVHAFRLSIPMQSILGVNYVLTKAENSINKSLSSSTR